MAHAHTAKAVTIAIDGAKHLFEIEVPMCFVQGSRDALADLKFLQPLAARFGARASLQLLPEAGHSFPVREETMDALAGWMESAAHATAVSLERGARP